MKNTVEGISSSLDDTEKQISNLGDRIIEITQTEQKKEKRILKNENSLKNKVTTNQIQTDNLHIEWEKIVSNDVTDKGLISKVYK